MSPDGDPVTGTEVDRLTAAFKLLAGHVEEVRGGLEKRDEDEAQARKAKDDALAAYGRTNRKWVIASIAGWVLDIILTITLIIVGIQTSSNTSRANDNAAAAHAAAAEATAAQRAGAAEVGKICKRLQQDAALMAPPGFPGSAAWGVYIERQHATLVGLGSDLGCRIRR